MTTTLDIHWSLPKRRRNAIIRYARGEWRVIHHGEDCGWYSEAGARQSMRDRLHGGGYAVVTASEAQEEEMRLAEEKEAAQRRAAEETRQAKEAELQAAKEKERAERRAYVRELHAQGLTVKELERRSKALGEEVVQDRKAALVKLGAEDDTGGRSGLVYEATARKLLKVSAAWLRARCRFQEAVNPHYKSGPAARLYDPRDLLAARDARLLLCRRA